jgi:hypothetical protein
MYPWYQKSEVCYAYLADVPSDWELNSDSDSNQRQIDASKFRKSSWFTRGWTLQELLAPEMLVFFDNQWREIGTSSSLSSLVEDITGFFHLHDISSASVAQKMCWASKRETTRPEDRAYSLLGLFNVNMPPLYGEGEDQAFLRLQLEIIKISDDDSIFAWTMQHDIGGLLANSPAAFADSGDIIRVEKHQQGNVRALLPYSMTNKGLQIQAVLGRVHGNPFLMTILHCCRREKPGFRVGVSLVYVDNDPEHRRTDYVRFKCDTLYKVDPESLPMSSVENLDNFWLQTIFVNQIQLFRWGETRTILLFVNTSLLGDMFTVSCQDNSNVLDHFSCRWLKGDLEGPRIMASFDVPLSKEQQLMFSDVYRSEKQIRWYSQPSAVVLFRNGETVSF